VTLEGQVAIVTGASRGIGQAIALDLARHGVSVACVATRSENAEPVVAKIRGFGGRAEPFGCDVGRSADVERVLEEIFGSLGDPAILINNAGVTRDGLLVRMSDEDFLDVIGVNLMGAFRMIRGVAKGMMRARYGRILNVSSIIGIGGGAGQANYAASKAGLIGLTKSVAKELGSRGITCNAIAPGFIESDMTAGLSEEHRSGVVGRTPVGRLGTPEDLVAAATMLCSPQAGFITGQVLTIDGGLTL
jgi:3-oxoacyl-[acyl-carrier protein] reductase